MKIRNFLIITACCLSISLVACAESKSESMNTSINSETETVDEISDSEASETPEALLYFPSDIIVNDFLVKYNALAENKISVEEIERGNIPIKALIYIDDFSMSVTNATNSNGTLEISMGMNPENEDTKLFNVFRDTIKAMRENISDDEIVTAWNDIHETGYIVEGYDFDGTKVTYIPSKQLSKRFSDPRIDLDFTIE